MAIPGTEEWVARWYTSYAIGICRRIAEGPITESPAETSMEMATCVALFYEGAPEFLRKIKAEGYTQAVRERLDKVGKELFGKDWETAKKIVSRFSEISELVKKKIEENLINL